MKKFLVSFISYGTVHLNVELEGNNILDVLVSLREGEDNTLVVLSAISVDI